MKPKAYSYTRMSTVDQLNGDSRRRQEERARRFADENGLEIVDRYDDFGVSAFRGRNAELGALSEFTRAIDEGEIARGSYLLVESMDRLTRQAIPKAMALLLGLTSRGISVAILDDRVYSESTDQEDTFALMSALMSMARSHEESKRKSSNLSAVWTNKRRLARSQGKVTTSKVPGWLRVRDGQVEQIPERVEVVREIFQLTKGGHGAYSIARRLNQRGEKQWSSRKNAVWRESYIKKILGSRTVLGEYQPHVMATVGGKRVRIPEGDPLIGYYPAAVSLVEFQDAASAIAARRQVGRGRKGKAYSNLFTGLLKCRCGAGYRYVNKGPPPKGGTYLHCSVAFSKGACDAKPISYPVFERVVLEAVDDLDVKGIMSGDRLAENVRALRLARAEAVERGAKLRLQAENLLAAIKNGGEGSQLLGLELTRTEASVSSEESEVARVDNELSLLLQVDPEQRLEIVRDLQHRLASEDHDHSDTRRALGAELQRLLTAIVIQPIGRVAWEVAEENPSWKSTYGVSSMAELEKLCRDLGFDLTLKYRGGDTVHYDAMDGELARVKKDVRMKSLEFLAK